jgi:cysteine desulfurase family protein (TIGR01976 family)
MPGFDVAQFRAQFPSLDSGLAHFDGPGGTQTPYAVGAAIAATLTGPLSNRGVTGLSETNAEAAVAAFRTAYADFLGVPERGVVYGRSATAMTFDLGRAVAATWRPGDEIVVSRLDHDANVRPWLILAERAGVAVRWLDFDPRTSDIIWESVESAISERTRLVAVTGASNLIGTIPPVAAIAARAHAVGALVWVDGVHLAAHRLVDVGALGADFFVCSPYKFLGPHCAVVGAAPELLETLRPDKLLPSSNEVPERFELGTLPYELMAGATAAVDVLAGLSGQAPDGADRRERLGASWEAVHAHESRLRSILEAGLAELGDRVVIHSRAADRTPTLFLTFPGRRSWDAYPFLSARGIQAPAGSFYAYEPFTRLGLADTHGLRVGLAPYTDDSDIQRLLDGLRAFLDS